MAAKKITDLTAATSLNTGDKLLITQGSDSKQADFDLVIPVGVIIDYAGSSAPNGWLICDGSAVSRSTYSNLFSAIGETYGSGDGSTTFNLPDCRGRTTIGEGQGSGLTNRNLGDSSGAETHQLTEAEMPSHSHDPNNAIDFNVRESTGGNSAFNPGGGSNKFIGRNRTDFTGSDAPHNNMQPYLVLNKIIKA